MRYLIPLLCVWLIALPAQAQVAKLFWKAPTTYTSGAPFDPPVKPPTYRIYVGPSATNLVFVLETQPIPEVYPSIQLSQIGLDVGECVAVSAVFQGAESSQSDPLCYALPVKPSGLYFQEQ